MSRPGGWRDSQCAADPDVPSVTLAGSVTRSKKPCGANRARASGNAAR